MTSSLAQHSTLDELLARFRDVPEEKREVLEEGVRESLRVSCWVPNPGPQTAALACKADELFYGGEAGGGKSDLVVGAALTKHTKSLILRRFNEDARALAERALEVLDTRSGYNGQLLHLRTPDRRFIEFAGVKDEKDKQRFKGRPHDLIAFDEIGDFLESQYRFIIGWNRSVDPRQRSRVLCTGNPPTTPEGLWVIKYWGAWLDPAHPTPAREGELRWYTTSEEGKDLEVDGPGPHWIGGEPVMARSRTFMRAQLSDNPDLTQDHSYAATLASLPAELRAAYRDGRFDIGLKDHPWQCMPTDWVRAAQERWTGTPHLAVPMCAIGVDVAQGGQDNNVIQVRHDAWFAKPEVIPGALTPLGGPDVAGAVVARRRDDAVVIVDCGGGYGGTVYKALHDNNIPVRAYKGAEAASGRTVDGKLRFTNRRTKTYWKLRELLDPSQAFGSPAMLPPDPELLADLTAPTFEVGPQGIKLEPADKVKDRIGRSPDKGSALVLAWSEGQRAITHLYTGVAGSKEMGFKARPQYPNKAVTSRTQSKRRRR